MEQKQWLLNGFGRIGRTVFRQGYKRGFLPSSINSLASIETTCHLLKYDSVHGIFPGEIVVQDENSFVIDGKYTVAYTSQRDPASLLLSDTKIVLECSGVFKTNTQLQTFLKAGAEKVLVSAPVSDADFMVVYGVNHETYDSKKHDIISNASCTTNALAPLVKALDEQFTITEGLLTTVHASTLDQSLLDTEHSDPRRARSAMLSMIPTSTGAAKAVGKILPHLEGKIDGCAIRVPTANVSLVDFCFSTKKKITKESVNEVLSSYSKDTLKGILAYEETPLVSIDFNGSTYSSVVDAALTMTMQEKMGKVFSWYDNESGFSNRMIDVANFIL